MSEQPFFFTWSAQKDARPMAIAGGEGAWFTTEDGARWLDMGALTYQVNAGHGHRRIIEAVREQADRLCLALPGSVYPEKEALARKLLAHAPAGFTKVFFTLGGADANENALKMARLVTGRHKVISRYRSYHGATMGAVTLSGDWRRPPVEPGIPGVTHVDEFGCPACPHGVRARTCEHAPLTRIPRTLELEGGVGAVFLESVVGGNGVLIPPTGAVEAIREACDRHGALLVMDEVLSGFGRTGKWFGLDHFGVRPDMITVGKAVTGGYGTLGAVLVHERVAEHFEEHVLVAGLTHYGHPLGVAAALAALTVCEEEGLADRAATLEPVLAEGLGKLVAAGLARQNRVIGLLSATELDLPVDGITRFRRALADRKVHTHLVARDRTLILSPPLCIGETDLREGVARVEAALREVTT